MVKLAVLLVLISQGIGGQQSGAENILASELFSEEEYLLGPGDSLMVVLKDLSLGYLTTINFGGIMPLMVPFFVKDSVQFRPVALKRVYNISIKELKDSLRIWYSSLLKVNEIDVMVISPRWLTVLVKGNTNTNGPANVRASSRLASLLSMETYSCGYDADINSILVETSKGETLEVDLEKYYKTGELRYNPLLAKVKSIFVPEIKKGIVIFGAVKGYPVKMFQKQVIQALGGNFTVSFEANVIKVPAFDSLKVRDVINKAGGVKSFALLSELYSSKRGKVTLDDYLPVGDTLYVPPFTDKVFVAGEVRNPGYVPYLPGATLETYLSYCGGFTNRAASHRIYVIRANRKVPKGKIGTVQPGDIIFVPEVKLKWFEDYLTLAQVVSSLLITWVTLKRL
jgi:hypothetical protein